jgi:hypothetical protein
MLNANATYYIVSQETAGGDAWYDFDTTIQTDSAATITSAVYASTTGSTGHSYIPVGFKFQ